MFPFFMLFTFFTPINLISAACIWYTPSVIFPTELVHLYSPLFHKPRRLSAITITSGNGTNDGGVSVLDGKDSNDGGVSAADGKDSHTLVRNGGLDKQGRVQYSIVYNASMSVPSLEYRLESVTPLRVSPQTLSGTTTLVNIDHTLAESLAFDETLVVTLSAWSSCLPTRALSEISYSFNVTASYELFYNHTNQLSPNDNANLVSVQVPQSNATHQWVQTPCLDSYIHSSLQVLNTSLYTQWQPPRWPNDNVHRSGGGPPRCHFKGLGNVCTVVARARFEYGRVCSRPITFSLWQSVSQISQQHYNWQPTTERPSDFDASHRLPVPDGLDMRYDVCEARVCSGSGSGCTPVTVQNDAYASAVQIELNQTVFSRRGVLETECRFEVVTFMDGMLSPWLHFRQSVGFNLHQPLDVPPTYSFQRHHQRRLRLPSPLN